MKMIQKYLAVLFLLMINGSIQAEQYEFEIPRNASLCSGVATTCGSDFQYGFIKLISNGNNSSKLTLEFSPSTIEEENEAYTYLITLPYDAIVSNISYYNINQLGIIPTLSNEQEYKSKIPMALLNFALGDAADRLGGLTKKIVPYISLVASVLDPAHTSRDESILYRLPNYPILDRELYPYNSFQHFFNRERMVASTVTFTINSSVSDVLELIRTHKMSVYVGGSEENELLVEGLSSLNEVTDNTNFTEWNPHPYDNYTNNLDISETLYIQGAETLSVQVVGTTERRYDYLWIYDENNNLVTKLDGVIDQRFVVNGSSITAHFTSDGSVIESGVYVSISEGGEIVPVDNITQDGHWISSGGRDPNTYRNIKYDFTLENSGRVSISLDATRSDDAYLYVLDSQGEVVLQDDDSGGDRDSFINNQSLSAGNYTIVVATYSVGKTGDFTLVVTGTISDFHQNLP